MNKAMLIAPMVVMSSSLALTPALAQQAVPPASPPPAAAAPDASLQVATGSPGNIDTGLQEIIVTARKREESLISVPVAVTVIGGQALQRYNATSLEQIAQLAPSLTITTVASGSGASLSIRGIGSVGEDPGVDQSVGVYMDNVGIGRGRIIGVSMFDINQVEVLKGPQALFFGKNSPAGVVSLTSAGPGNHFEGRVSSGYEFDANEKYLDAAVGGPITPTFGVRAAVHAEGMDGFIRNDARPLLDPLTGLETPGAADPRSPKQKQFAGRLTLKYAPTSEFNITAKLLGAYNHTNDPAGQVEHNCLPGVSLSVAGVPDPVNDCSLGHTHSNTGINPILAQNWPHANGGKLYGETHYYSGSVTANYSFDDLAVTSVTAYSRLTYHDLFNSTQSNYEALIPQSNELTKTFSQEARLNSDYDGPLNFTVGAYYENVKRSSPNAVAILFTGPDLRTGEPRNWNFTREADNKSNTISGFGQLRWNLLPNLELAGGVRYSRDDKHVVIGNSFVNDTVTAVFGPGFLLPEGEFLRGRFKHSNWSPEATLTWHPDKNQTLYAAYKTGYKSGGFSNTLLLGGNFNIDDLTYAPETTKGGEVGYKAELFNHHVRIETDVYSYKFKGLQLSAFDAATFSYFIRNAAAARTSGVELSAEWQVDRVLTLRAQGAYNRAKFLSFPGAQCYQGQTIAQGCSALGTQELGGKALPRAPKWTFDPGFTLTLPVTSDLRFGIDGDAHYKSRYYTDPSLAPFPAQRGYWLLNAAIRLSSQHSGWEISLIGRNLTNKVYVEYTTDSGLAPVGVWNSIVQRGRQVALQGSLNF